MGIIKDTVLLEKALRADFLKAYNNGEDPNEIMPFLMKTKSSAKSEKYGWLGQVPNLSEWKDERQLRGLLDFDYEIVNKSYEATLQVDRDELEDDQLGAIKVRISDLARKARTSHPMKRFYDLLEAGTTDLCYDGQAFFSNSHSEGSSGTQDNLYSGTGVTIDKIKADFIGARAAMRGFKDDQGEPMNEGEMQLYVVMPQGLEGIFDELLMASDISSTTNTLKGAAKKVVSSRLSDSNDWYLINGAGAIKPFIWQIRRQPTFESLEKGEAAFMRKQIPFGIDTRDGFGYGLWQKAVKVVNS